MILYNQQCKRPRMPAKVKNINGANKYTRYQHLDLLDNVRLRIEWCKT